MKKRLLPLISLLLLICLLASCHKGQKVTYQRVQKVGSLPEALRLLTPNSLPLHGICTEKGYYLALGQKENLVCFYDLNGKLVWQKTYDFGTSGASYSMSITPVNNGFFLSRVFCTYQEANGTWVKGAPVLARCSGTGDILWSYEYTGLGDRALMQAFALADGGVITIGQAEQNGTDGNDILLTKLSADGKLLQQVTYGGSSDDEVWEAHWVPGKGIAASINTHSADGTFAEPKNNTGVSVVALFGENLELCWYHKLEAYLSDPSLLVEDGAIYALAEQEWEKPYLLLQFTPDGTLCQQVKTATAKEPQRLVGFLHGQVVLQTDKDLVFLSQDLKRQSIVPFDAGTVEKIMAYGDGFLVLSTNITGIFHDQPLYVSTLWHTTELVYSGYDTKGSLLWRDAFDSTPEYQFAKPW